MNAISFLSNNIVKSCIKNYQDIDKLKQKYAYNIFTLSSYNSYLENFHSDIIALLLNPKGIHNEGNKFLYLFIDYLNSKPKVKIEKTDFQNVHIHREKGDIDSRIDIIILDHSSKKAIIIENKINNADDLNEQIDRYYKLVKDWDYKTVCIIYLSSDGLKSAPAPKEENAKEILINLAAFDNSNSDLCSGWLEKCYANSTLIDNQSLIYQYIKLIKHQINHVMDTNNIDAFYNYISNNNLLIDTENLITIINSIPNHRADNIVKKIGASDPFKYVKYADNVRIYHRYFESDNHYKIGFIVIKSGEIEVTFEVFNKQDDIGYEIARQKLTSMNMFSGFDKAGHRLKKIIADNKPLIEIDKEAIHLIKCIIEKFGSK